MCPSYHPDAATRTGRLRLTSNPQLPCLLWFYTVPETVITPLAQQLFDKLILCIFGKAFAEKMKETKAIICQLLNQPSVFLC